MFLEASSRELDKMRYPGRIPTIAAEEIAE
jgi:hypothetical protein